jgi:gentisate 1,2-dioxygenase
MKTLDTLYAAIEAASMEGGWHRKRPALWAEPHSQCVPAQWRYDEVRPILEAAGHLVDHELAERRNLTLSNPAPGNWYATVRTLVAAYQSIKPGEHALSHRHTPNALRIILEGRGTYTVVNGTRVEMRPGDVLLTPSWCWHAHEAIGPDECFWIDVLDVPLVHLLEPMFFERHPARFEPVREQVDASPLAFRWEDSQRRLDTAEAPADGMSEREIELGSPAMKTTAIHVQRMGDGFTSPLHRTTANAVFAVVEGAGRTRIGGQEFTWRRGDVLAVPGWQPYEHRVSEAAHLVRVSDEPLMRAFDWLRHATPQTPDPSST